MKSLLLFLMLCAPIAMFAQDADEAVKDAAKEVKEQAEKIDEAVEKLEEKMDDAKEGEKAEAEAIAEEKAEEKAEEDAMPVYARPSFEVSEEEKDMFTGIQPSLTMFIPDATAKEVANEWKDLMNEYKADKKIAKSKVKKEDNDVMANQIIIPQISNELIDVYTTAVETNGGVELSTSWAISPSDYVNYEVTPKKYAVAEQMMQTFAGDFTREMIIEEQKTEEKELKNRKSSHEKLVKKNQDLHSDIAKKKQEIEKAKADIKEAERGIIENEAEQVKAVEAIAAQEKVMNFVQSKLLKF